jgi:RND superfamily putative drug exporter
MTTTPSNSPSVFVRLARWCMTHRWQTVLMWVVAVVAAFSIGGAVGTKDTSNFRLPGTESQRAYDLLAEHAPKANGGTDQIVYVAKSGTLRDGAAKQSMEASRAKVAADKIVADVSDPLAPGSQLTKDGRIGVATITYKKDFQAYKPADFTRVQKAVFAERGPQLQIEHGGFGAETARFAEQGGGTEGLSLLAAALILLITFGSVIAAGVPLLTAMLALGTTIGLVPLISQVVDTPDFATQLAALIGLGVGVDYALIVVTRYRAEYGRIRREQDALHAQETPEEALAREQEDPAERKARVRALRSEAILRAQDTAGRTVFFAACTVIIALLGLLLLGLSFLHGPSIASALAVLLTMLGALTVLPALLSRSGDWIDRLRLPLPGREKRAVNAAAGESAAWARWSGFVQRNPWPSVVAALLVLLALASPALGMRLGSADAGLDPAGTTTRNAYDLIAKGFGPGINGSFLLATQLPKAGDEVAAKAVADAIAKDPGVALVTPPQLSPDKQIATIVLFPKTGPQDLKTTRLLERLRANILPPVEKTSGTAVYVGGQTASQEDFSDVIAGKLPLFMGVVVLLSALLLMAVFRSIFIPIKAACMNLLSIGAALGFVTLVFQHGFLDGVLDTGVGPIESFVPVMMFAIVFGLSMDYEVFLVSRMHEEWQHTDDPSRAIGNGLATTGRVVTAAATIMIVVFATFALGDDRVIKEFGLGLAIAVLLDAFIIRVLLVPALMQLAGRWAWWLPAGLDRRLPQIALERE